MDRLEGHAIVVTGAAKGIGLAIARRVVAEGASAVLVDTNDSIQDLATEMDRAVAVVGDICDPDVAPRTLEAAQRISPAVGLVNNAAFIPPREKLLHMRDETWKKTMQVNLEAPVQWCRTFLPHMLERQSGAIVNIATIEANFVGPAGTAYHISKAGLLALTRTIAVEYGREGVRCNSVSPGSVRTDIFEELMAAHPGLEETVTGLNFAGRVGKPDEIAGIVAHLLSDESGFTNGADHIVDGGRLTATLGAQGALG